MCKCNLNRRVLQPSSLFDLYFKLKRKKTIACFKSTPPSLLSLLLTSQNSVACPSVCRSNPKRARCGPAPCSSSTPETSTSTSSSRTTALDGESSLWPGSPCPACTSEPWTPRCRREPSCPRTSSRSSWKRDPLLLLLLLLPLSL